MLTRDQLREAAVRIGTLPQLSVRAGHVKTYFGVRMQRFKDHPTMPFPEPLDEGPPATYDGIEVAVWDERRKLRTGKHGASRTNDNESEA